MFLNWNKKIDLFEFLATKLISKYDKRRLIRRNIAQCAENLSSCSTQSSKSSTSGEFLLPNVQEQITPLEILNDQIEIVAHTELETTKT